VNSKALGSRFHVMPDLMSFNSVNLWKPQGSERW